MADKSFTLFEVHLHDGVSISGTNTAPAVGDVGDGSTAEGEASEPVELDDAGDHETPDDSSGPGAGLAVFVGLVLVAGLAVAARVLMGDDDLEELEELDDLAAEA
jgi:hypothetical protein